MKKITSVKLIYISFLVVSGFSCSNVPTYKNPEAPVQDRVTDLLKRMTLDEKVFQLLSYKHIDTLKCDDKGNVDPTDTFYLNRCVGYVGIEKYSTSVKMGAIAANAIQKYLIEKSRLGIPCFILSEGLHGFMAKGATSFPIPIGISSSWDTSLIEQVYTITALEARIRGSQQFLSPVIDLGREPRWGRFEETFGEDPYLVSRIGLAAILGFQGRSQNIDSMHAAVTLKHFSGHGQPEGGRNTAPVNYSERIFRETHLYPFEIAVKRGHAHSVMASYNEWDEVPNHMNKKLLVDILQKEWGFDGYIMSDGGGIDDLYKVHYVAKDKAEAAKLALEAGIDMDLSSFDGCFHTLIDQVKEGEVSESTIDRAVKNILKLKFSMGLFENPYINVDDAVRLTNCKEHKALALKASEEALILLKNEKNTLPFDSSKIKNLAVIGPNAADVHLGGYSAFPMMGVSVLKGIQNFAAGKFNIKYAEGCKITTNEECNWIVNGNPILNSFENDLKLINEAVQVAKGSDAIVLVLGENELTCREAWNETHLGDRDNLDLVGRQNDLAKAIFAVGKPVVVVLLNGRPLTVNYIAENANAIIEGWYMGEEGGNALANVVFGKINPSGKLTCTFPRSVGQLPCYYNKRPSQHRSYTLADNSPLFPFGFGLSYTTFEYSNLMFNKDSIATNESIEVSVDVKNSGEIAGDEIVQLYIHDKIASLPRTVQELKDFARIHLEAGEAKKVIFTLTPDKLQFYNIQMKRVVEPGNFDIMVGKSSMEYLIKTLKVY